MNGNDRRYLLIRCGRLVPFRCIFKYKIFKNCPGKTFLSHAGRAQWLGKEQVAVEKKKSFPWSQSNRQRTTENQPGVPDLFPQPSDSRRTDTAGQKISPSVKGPFYPEGEPGNTRHDTPLKRPAPRSKM
ncbi:hypothetical protein Bbelb_278910 [Branchiostoma belcheri]|nr:hypothetical protein Bbelb_278910 [Branchiostoma belcheri]